MGIWHVPDAEFRSVNLVQESGVIRFTAARSSIISAILSHGVQGLDRDVLCRDGSYLGYCDLVRFVPANIFICSLATGNHIP
jgi:hypothetical protein